MPLKSGILDFLQDAHKETTQALISTIIDNPATGTIYVLSGCVNTGSGANYIISAGQVFYNGEIFQVDATSFTVAGGQYAFANLITTQYTTNADPVTFTDGIPRNVCNIRKIEIISSTGTGYPLYSDFEPIIKTWLTGDTKEVVCDSTYLSTNFDSTGLGKNERVGWAIMNGNNGTPNDNGLVSVAYGTDYTTLGATGGSKDAVVVSHTHTITAQYNGTDGSANGLMFPSGDSSGSGTPSTNNAVDGVSGTDKNMQPYVVRLRIMKI